MTEIKVRYERPICTHWKYRNLTMHHDEYWWCDDNDGCPIGEYERPDVVDLSIVNPQCRYLDYKSGEFATTVKRYAWEDGVFTMNGRSFTKNEIRHLEIDGRVIIDGNK